MLFALNCTPLIFKYSEKTEFLLSSRCINMHTSVAKIRADLLTIQINRPIQLAMCGFAVKDTFHHTFTRVPFQYLLTFDGLIRKMEISNFYTFKLEDKT